MLYIISIPIIDYRPFLDEPTFRLNVEQFPRYWNDGSFLRSFGQFSESERSIAFTPFSEKAFAEAGNGIHLCYQSNINQDGTVVFPSCTFRRVFFDSYSARIDIGITNKIQSPYLPKKYYVDDIIRTYQYFIKYPIYNTPLSKGNAKPLYEIGQDILRQYLYATTLQPGVNFSSAKTEWLSIGHPAIVVKCSDKELCKREDSFVQKGFSCLLGMPPEWGVSLWYRRAKRGIPVYVIILSEKCDKDKARALRVNILKYHQEIETLRAVIKLLARYDNQLTGINVNYLSSYFTTVTSLFSRKSRDGIIQKPIWKLISQIEDSIEQNLCDELYNKLENDPRLAFLSERVKKTIQNLDPDDVPCGNFTTININGGSLVMGSQFNTQQAGNVGPNAGKHSTIYQTFINGDNAPFDYQKMRDEVAEIRKELRSQNTGNENEKDIALGKLAELDDELKKKNDNNIKACLGKLGKEVYDIAKRIGCTILAGILKGILGL